MIMTMKSSGNIKLIMFFAFIICCKSIEAQITPIMVQKTVRWCDYKLVAPYSCRKVAENRFKVTTLREYEYFMAYLPSHLDVAAEFIGEIYIFLEKQEKDYFYHNVKDFFTIPEIELIEKIYGPKLAQRKQEEERLRKQKQEEEERLRRQKQQEEERLRQQKQQEEEKLRQQKEQEEKEERERLLQELTREYHEWLRQGGAKKVLERKRVLKVKDMSDAEFNSVMKRHEEEDNRINAKKDFGEFLIVEHKPIFQGGDENTFKQWVDERLQYPKAARENGVQGRVMLSFIVGIDGRVTDVVVLRGVDPALDEEAVIVVSSSPRWIPGVQRNKPVRVRYNFPVIFQLR